MVTWSSRKYLVAAVAAPKISAMLPPSRLTYTLKLQLIKSVRKKLNVILLGPGPKI